MAIRGVVLPSYSVAVARLALLFRLLPNGDLADLPPWAAPGRALLYDLGHVPKCLCDGIRKYALAPSV